MDVGLQQSEPDLAHRPLQHLLGDATLTLEAAKDTLQSLFETGDSKAVKDKLMPLDEVWEIGGLSEIREMEKKYAE